MSQRGVGKDQMSMGQWNQPMHCQFAFGGLSGMGAKWLWSFSLVIGRYNERSPHNLAFMTVCLYVTRSIALIFLYPVYLTFGYAHCTHNLTVCQKKIH